MVVAVEVACMTLSAGAAVTAIDPGIAIAVDAIDQCAVGARMTEETVVGMNRRDYITAVAVEAECGGGDGAAVVMTVRASEVVGPMALATG